MGQLDWGEVMIVVLLALCVMGPICVVLLTQNFPDAADDVGPEHFDFDAVKGNAPSPAGERDRQVPPAN